MSSVLEMPYLQHLWDIQVNTPNLQLEIVLEPRKELKAKCKWQHYSIILKACSSTTDAKQCRSFPRQEGTKV